MKWSSGRRIQPFMGETFFTSPSLKAKGSRVGTPRESLKTICFEPVTGVTSSNDQSKCIKSRPTFLKSPFLSFYRFQHDRVLKRKIYKKRRPDDDDDGIRDLAPVAIGFN